MYLRKNSRSHSEISIEEPLNIDWEGNELLLGDVLGTDTDSVSGSLETEMEITVLKNAVNRLAPREREIMELRFGLRGGTQKQVADVLGISQSYISRLEKKILKRLKKELEQYC